MRPGNLVEKKDCRGLFDYTSRLAADGLKFLLDFPAWLLCQQTHHHNAYAREDEGGQQLIDIPMPPMGLIRRFQTNTITPPPIMPAMAPARLIRFQNRLKSISGPKVAPKPAQAKETMVKMTLSSSMAIKIAMAQMISRARRLIQSTLLSEAFFFIKP